MSSLGVSVTRVLFWDQVAFVRATELPPEESVIAAAVAAVLIASLKVTTIVAFFAMPLPDGETETIVGLTLSRQVRLPASHPCPDGHAELLQADPLLLHVSTALELAEQRCAPGVHA